ncbi:MAG TPA: flagellar motor switch protein FliN [Kineosporiaceae bacterium]|nr:flagellar motor switch protein FliN [Kineosporiaceae bacterium]
MSFSASPLVPGQQVEDAEAWKRAAGQVLGAVSDALPQIPSAGPLVPDAPVQDAASTTLPDPVGAAVTAYLGAGAEGKVLLVVGAELVEALKDTPFGALEPAQALRPALDTLAEKLGGRLEGSPTAIAPEDCLAVLSGGTTVIVPLVDGETVRALIGVTLAPRRPPKQAEATAGGAARSWGIDMLRDVEMEVTCELGRTRMTVRQLLALAPGDVVELDRLAGSPADLLVNGTLLARGEVVVVDESFGLRITEIVTKDAR